MSEDLIIFGGVQLNKNEVAYKKTVTDINGTKHYFVIFKNGIRAAYQGANGEYAFISSYDLGSNKYSPDTNLFSARRIKGLEVKGAEYKKDNINVYESSIIGIDVSDDSNFNFEDYVTIEASKSTFGARAMSGEDYHYGDGMIEADSCDSISIDDASKGLRNKINIKS